MKKYLTLTLLAMAAAFSFTSCDDDDWVRIDIENEYWRITDIRVLEGQCPYRYNDEFYFSSSGQFYGRSYDGTLDEHGWWDVRDRVLRIRFDGDPDFALEAEFVVQNSNRMELDCWDYAYGSHYLLRLVNVGNVGGYW